MTSLPILIALLALASWAGVALARCFPWTNDARHASLPTGLGIGLGPMLAGLAAVVAVGLFPGHHGWMHVGVALLLLAASGLIALRCAPQGENALARRAWRPYGLAEWSMVSLLAAFAAAIALDLMIVPLIQNDALEYATVGRILHESGSLASYPAVQPATERSGFFGPWTHPPLYVALIHLAYTIQGDADLPLTMRLIAPWFLAAGAFCVLTLGRLHSMRAGLTAALMFAATPMLFLGATSALIDPLPVLGMTLSLAAVVGMDGSPLRRGAALGLVLGLALWMHSQAILFPLLLLPLLWFDSRDAARPGFANHLKRTGATAALAVVVMLLLGAAPYLRNIAIFGSPISDNPEVFAFGPLGWDDYFRHQRGIADPVEIVQYGVLKGFFSVEAYSWVFWLALSAVPLAWRAAMQRLRGGAEQGPASRLAATSLGVLLAYFAGTALSAALGIDLMIRNERYLLVVIPAVAIMVAMGLAAGEPPAADPTGRWRAHLLAIVLVLMPLQLLTLVAYRQLQLRGELVVFDEVAKLHRWPPFRAMEALRRATPPDALVLTMKPADMLHAQRRMLSYLDPRAIPFYSEVNDSDAALATLRRLGVTHVHATDYFLPPMFRTRLMEILADRRRATLVSDHEGYQIYALRFDGPSQALDSPVDLIVPDAWSRLTQFVLAGRKTRARVTLAIEPYRLGQASINNGFAGVFHRESGRSMMSESIRLPAVQAGCGVEHRELVVDLTATGIGHFQVLARLQDSTGAMVENRLLGDMQVTKARPDGRLLRRALLPASVASVRLVVEHRGASQLALQQVTLRVQCTSAAP